MYNHNKAQQSKNRVHISWDILYASLGVSQLITKRLTMFYRSGLLSKVLCDV